MKKLMILSSLLLASLQSFSCPELTGDYKCRNGVLKIQQQTHTSGAMKYIIGSAYFSEVYITDNKIRSDGDITYQAYCKIQELKVIFKFGPFSTSDSYTLNTENNLVLFTRNVVIPSSETCTRIQEN